MNVFRKNVFVRAEVRPEGPFLQKAPYLGNFKKLAKTCNIVDEQHLRELISINIMKISFGAFWSFFLEIEVFQEISLFGGKIKKFPTFLMNISPFLNFILKIN